MANVIINFDQFEKCLLDYFSEKFIEELTDHMSDNDVFLGNDIEDCFSEWIPVSEKIPDDKDIYEVTASRDFMGKEYVREYAYYDSRIDRWRSHFSGALLYVLAWKPHTKLFTE